MDEGLDSAFHPNLRTAHSWQGRLDLTAMRPPPPPPARPQSRRLVFRCIAHGVWGGSPLVYLLEKYHLSQPQQDSPLVSSHALGGILQVQPVAT